MTGRCPILSAVLAAACLAITGHAKGGAIENSISFQARLTDDQGDPLPNGPYTLDFFFYDVEVAGTPIGEILNVPVTVSGGNGVVTKALDIDPAWFASAPRYLGMTVDDTDDDPQGDELMPRILMTAVPFAVSAGGQFSGDVHVAGELDVDGGIQTSGPTFGEFSFRGVYQEPGDVVTNWLNSGNDADVHRCLGGPNRYSGFGIMSRGGTEISSPFVWMWSTNVLQQFQVRKISSTQMISEGDVLFAVGSQNWSKFNTNLEVDGITETDVLVIMGGADLAEPFVISSSGDTTIRPGMVMVIDEDHPGQLKASTEAYDRKVAGIVSGANGLKPGMIMRADGQPYVDGECNVALTGRVWCWCDASFGSIEPGDLLTTSSVAGHAMPVTEFDRAHGSVIGKAMTSLNDGRGLVLVLVNLQ